MVSSLSFPLAEAEGPSFTSLGLSGEISSTSQRSPRARREGLGKKQ